MEDKWSCLDCFWEGKLTIHGACERCGSQAVVVPYEIPSGDPFRRDFRLEFRPVGELPDGVQQHWWSFRFYVDDRMVP